LELITPGIDVLLQRKADTRTDIRRQRSAAARGLRKGERVGPMLCRQLLILLRGQVALLLLLREVAAELSLL
jgi:hypothetical protein